MLSVRTRTDAKAISTDSQYSGQSSGDQALWPEPDNFCLPHYVKFASVRLKWGRFYFDEVVEDLINSQIPEQA